MEKLNSLNRISHPHIRVYLAGKMEWFNQEDSRWTCVLSDDLRRFLATYLPPCVEIVYPDDTGFDHGGDSVSGIVAADIYAVRMSNAVIAIFSTPNQIGTLIEVLDAVLNGKEVLCIFTDKNLGCAWKKLEGPVSFRAESDDYWFLINYLLGDGYGGFKLRRFETVDCVICLPEMTPHLIVRWVQGLVKRIRNFATYRRREQNEGKNY